MPLASTPTAIVPQAAQLRSAQTDFDHASRAVNAQREAFDQARSAEADAKGWAPRSEARGGSLGGGAEGAGDPQAGTPYAIDVNAGWRLPVTGLLCKEPPYGGIRAIDVQSGKTLWDRPFGTARKNGPFGIPSMLPLEIGTPNNGGSVVTAGGLIFIASATDDLIRAIDIETGKYETKIVNKNV